MDQPKRNNEKIRARLFSDPSCPWAYSASPALRVIEWRYRDQIEWHLSVIEISSPGGDEPAFEPAEMARRQAVVRDRFGMPFTIEPKIRSATSARACQAIVASRVLHPGSEWRVLRTLQLLQFNSPLLLDDDHQIEQALGTVEGLDAAGVMAAIDTPEVLEAYRKDLREAREVTGGPADHQGKTGIKDGKPRYSAPTVLFSRGDLRLEAGGFQPVEAYDLAIANLGPDLNRHGPAGDPLDALALYPAGLTTQEVAALLVNGNSPPDRLAAEQALVLLLGERKVRRLPMGNDALWVKA